MGKFNLKETVKSVPGFVKTHWNTPSEGEYLSLKEMGAYAISLGGSYVYMTASGIMTFSASYFCGAIMGISAMDFYVIGLIGTILGYVLMFTNPLGVLIYENHGVLTPKMKVFAHAVFLGKIALGLLCYFLPSDSLEFIMRGFPQILGNLLFLGGVNDYVIWFIRRKFCAKYGRLKPLILICGIPAAVIMSVIPYLPVQGLSYTAKMVILHFAFTIMNNFYGNFANVPGMINFMTPNSQERQRLISYMPIIAGFFSSVTSLFFPMLIATTGGYLNLLTYKVFVPIFAAIGLGMTMVIAICKERIIEPPMEKRKRVTFWHGAKNVLSNKYFWITNIAGTLGQWQGLITNLLQWWFIYALRLEWAVGIASNLVVMGMTLGSLMCPFFTKHFQKRDILLISRGITLLTVFGIAIAVHYDSIAIFLISMFLRNTISPVMDGVNGGFQADILTYHQWKYGERADSMCGVFSWFLSPISMVIGYVVPQLQKMVGFTSDWDVLYDSAILTKVFNIYTWASIIGLVLATVPFFFYDLTKEKHDECVKELQARVRAIEEETDEAAEAVSVAEGV